jgi:dTDP-4-amino-4,6-dideoxygalactose transaminase
MTLKTSVDELAIFSGQPAFDETLHVGRPNIGNREHLLDRINDILDNRWLTNNGPYVQEFQQRVADYLGVKHFVAITNGTIALEIAIRALGMTGEVIVPSLTFVATAHALQWQEITPVFADVNPDTYNLDPDAVERMITPRTTGIVGVHLWGRACEVERLSDIAQRHNLKLMYDAAHAFGCSYDGVMIGNFGDAEVFSFHATKFFNTFEGGGIATNNDDLAARLRLMKNFGFAGVDTVTHVGTNGKMSEISAAMGLTQLEDIDMLIETNRRNYTQYCAALSDLPGVKVIDYDGTEHLNYQYIVLEVDEAKAGLSRDELVTLLKPEKVLARRYFYPGCHQMEPYRSYFPHAGLLLPHTERLSTQLMSLPNGTAVGPDEVAGVSAIIRLALEHAGEVRAQLAHPVQPHAV